MGQVCFTAISSNGACHPRSSLLSVQCARSCSLCPLSECSVAGVRVKVPSSLIQVSCRLSGCVHGKHSARHTPVCLVGVGVGVIIIHTASVLLSIGICDVDSR